MFVHPPASLCRTLLACSLTTVLANALVPSAHAQGDDDRLLEEVVVTAQFREEKLQERR